MKGSRHSLTGQTVEECWHTPTGTPPSHQHTLLPGLQDHSCPAQSHLPQQSMSNSQSLGVELSSYSTRSSSHLTLEKQTQPLDTPLYLRSSSTYLAPQSSPSHTVVTRPLFHYCTNHVATRWHDTTSRMSHLARHHTFIIHDKSPPLPDDRCIPTTHTDPFEAYTAHHQGTRTMKNQMAK